MSNIFSIIARLRKFADFEATYTSFYSKVPTKDRSITNYGVNINGNLCCGELSIAIVCGLTVGEKKVYSQQI
jgi:hypothetical protein